MSEYKPYTRLLLCMIVVEFLTFLLQILDGAPKENLWYLIRLCFSAGASWYYPYNRTVR